VNDQESRVHDVVFVFDSLLQVLSIAFDELKIADIRGPQDFQGFPPDLSVNIEPGNFPTLSDNLSHQPHDFAWSASYVQATHTFSQPRIR
jgi:hypothetical protein